MKENCITYNLFCTVHRTVCLHNMHIAHYAHLLVLHGTPNWLLEGSGGLITVLARETEHPLNPFPFCYILLQHCNTSAKFYNSFQPFSVLLYNAPNLKGAVARLQCLQGKPNTPSPPQPFTVTYQCSSTSAMCKCQVLQLLQRNQTLRLQELQFFAYTQLCRTLCCK